MFPLKKEELDLGGRLGFHCGSFCTICLFYFYFVYIVPTENPN